ncbi:transposase IS4 family protein [Thiorhodococcus drewsii AZ1]|uniref:Transposase IS4 family protein n=2 Tax=Thiorhodococcus drewsii AZ1 TaxID=765913 RepID=G2E7L7_9GAMM|nr:ISAs1 family transposase [Thiorhodococcus drewsii]EGV27901.1 transposase IS4 family protein [Thiorhodococcus drewsii AZ1]
MSASMIEHFASLEDPRIERNKLYPLKEILLLTVCGVLSGADGWEAIEQFGEAKLEWLRRFCPFENGIPSHDRIANVISRLNPKRFEDCFIRWTQAVTESMQGEVIAVDGKTARGSRDRRRERAALHMVSAWAVSNRLVLGQEATAEKSNEITAIPELLELLVLKGCIVTIDAMGCQRAIAEQIRSQGGDYVLGLKGNQSTLQEPVEDVFTTAVAGQFSGVAHAYTEKTDKDHGRLEIRRYWITEDLRTLPNAARWAGLRSIGMVERTCWQDGVQSVEQRYFIASIGADAQRFATAVRGHVGRRKSSPLALGCDL